MFQNLKYLEPARDLWHSNRDWVNQDFVLTAVNLIIVSSIISKGWFYILSDTVGTCQQETAIQS